MALSKTKLHEVMAAKILNGNVGSDQDLQIDVTLKGVSGAGKKGRRPELGQGKTSNPLTTTNLVF